jgi:predicted sulfurtransferase
MRVSTEFPMWAKENIDSLRDKQVLMYCTGGIRCERASALIRSLGHDNVFQLKGGIHKYLEEFPEGSDSQWSGKNYTFDKRSSLPRPLLPLVLLTSPQVRSRLRQIDCHSLWPTISEPRAA